MSDCVYNDTKWYEEQPNKLRSHLISMIANMQKPIYYHGFNIVNLDLRTFLKVSKPICQNHSRAFVKFPSTTDLFTSNQWQINHSSINILFDIFSWLLIFCQKPLMKTYRINQLCSPWAYARGAIARPQIRGNEFRYIRGNEFLMYFRLYISNLSRHFKSCKPCIDAGRQLY